MSSDRAIEALYYTQVSRKALHRALGDGRDASLGQALHDALETDEVASLEARAVLSFDLWSAHDFLVHTQSWTTPPDSLTGRAGRLLSPIRRLMSKIALSQAEVGTLRDNLAAAGAAGLVPNPITDGGWIEVVTPYSRGHESSSNFRRVTRVFLQVNSTVEGPEMSIVDAERLAKEDINAVALLIQNLIVTSDGTVQPTPITYSVQIRRFMRDSRRKIERTKLAQYEFNRRLFIAQPASGGLVKSDTLDAYLARSGNDFGFATPNSPGPIKSTLRQRCGVCHQHPLADRFFSLHIPKHPGRLLTKDHDRSRAWSVSRWKQSEESFQGLVAEWHD